MDTIDMNPIEDMDIVEDPLKTLVRGTIANGTQRKEFKRSVKKHLIKVSTSTREITRLRIKASHKMIDKYYRDILAESKNDET